MAASLLSELSRITPAVVPYVALFGDVVAQLIGVRLLVVLALFHRPERVAAPREVEVDDLVDHVVLAEVHLIAGDAFALFGEQFFCGVEEGFVRAVDELVGGEFGVGLAVGLAYAVGEQPVLFHIEDHRGVAVAHAVLHEDHVLELGVVALVPEHTPAVFFEFLLRDDAGVVKEPQRAPTYTGPCSRACRTHRRLSPFRRKSRLSSRAPSY